jgi:hypothetical protein
MPKLTNELIAAAIEGFEAQKGRIDEQIAELRQMLNPAAATEPATPAPAKRKRRISAAGRRAIGEIGEAARKRWAAIKAGKPAPAPGKAARKKASSKRAPQRAAAAKKTAGRARAAA